jgi:glucose/arabinose dehydrogenase/PKD repeat protein
MSLGWDQFARSLVARRTPRSPPSTDKKTASPATSARSDTPLVFESLEPRLLLAADPLGITAGYAFSEASGTTTVDVSGHGLTGTLVNGAAFSTAGKYGNALALDGVNDYVNLGNPTALRLTGSMTVSAWIYSTGFPGDDAAIVSKRTGNDVGFQLDTTVDKGPRTIGFKLTNSSGGQMFRYGATTLQPNTWYYVTGVYNATAQTLDVYLNGQLDNGVLQGTVTSSQQNSTANVTIGRRAGVTGYEFIGRIDDVRIADHALTQDQIQTDMVTPLAGAAPGPDTIAPTVALTAPTAPAVAGTVSVTASASDNVGVAGVQFLLDGNTLAAEDPTSPYSVSWNTTTAVQGIHTLAAQARDAAGNSTVTAPVTVTVDNQAPTGTVAINNGAPATNTRNVTLALSASDAVTSVTQMRFSNTGTSFSAAEAFAVTKAWTLSTGAGTKTVYVQFRDAAGNWSTSVTDTIVLDTTAPMISARTATNIASTSATVTWTTNEPATSQVNYGLTTSYGSTTTLDPALLTSHSVALASLAPNTTYNYRVRSIDAAGNETVSANSTFRTAAGADTVAPSIPAGLTATPVSTTQINLAWSASTDNVAVTGYQVFRNGGANPIATTTTPSYSDTGLTPNTSYQYALKAFDAAGNLSALSATVSAATPASGADISAPSIPDGLTATPASTTQINLAWNPSTDNVAVTGYQVFRNGGANPIATTTTPNYSDTALTPNTTYQYALKAFDAAGNLSSLSATVSAATPAQGAPGSFQNQILATGFDLPIAIKFLPDGRMLVAEFAGKIKVLPAPYTQASPTLFLQLTNVAPIGGEVDYGIMDFALDPNFSSNHYFYVFYTAASPNRDRLSRFTANDTLTGTIAGSELVIYQDPQGDVSDNDHHGGAINFGNDGKIYLTTGDHFYNPGDSQLLTSPRGKILRINSDGTVPTDNPFYDGAGPNYDAIWALGLRNPYRAYYDAPTGRLLIGDVGGNDYATAIEEMNIGARGANFGWPNVEAPNGNPAYTAPAYYYPHNGRDASITGGFVYHGTQFPSSYQGSYFFADYTQNWIKRLTFDANGNVNGVFNFEPANGANDGPYGDIVYLTEGPEGALYYVDLGFSEVNGTFGVSKIRRISFVSSDLPPLAQASANPTEGTAPLTVSFSSAGSSDPEGKPLTYSWVFGDGETSTDANPTHTYAVAGPYQARLTVSDGVNSTLSTPLSIAVGNRPEVSITDPTNGVPFRAGDVITFTGTATDRDDGVLPANAYTWNIDFLHEGHVHPGTPIVGSTTATLTIPTSGHDFSGFTRYRITLTVTDSSGLQSSASVIVNPEKVNLTFDAVPAGLTLYLDGIAHTAPFVYDTLVGFNHTIEARNQTIGANTYTFASWSDGGAMQHSIMVPTAAQTYTANYTVTSAPVPIAFVQVNAAVPQSNQSSVSVTYTSAQVAGDTNILAIGWNNATSNITSVTDSAGNVYRLAVPTARGTGLSQAIYYASNIKAAAAGTNTVTVTFSASTPYIDVRITEYRGLDPVNPFDAGTSASGTSASASSGSVTTTAARELIFGAGMTLGGFSSAGTSFSNRIITNPDADIVEDRSVAAIGTYAATAPLSGSAAWVMQVATFKGAGQA